MTEYKSRGRRTAVQKAAFAFGLVFLIIGILGFIPGITDGALGDLEIAGHDHAAEGGDALLLGIFAVSVLHNIVHILFGVVLLLASRPRETARTALIISGVIYLLLSLYGLLVGLDNDWNFLPFNLADNWLHLALGVVLLLCGVLLSNRPRGEEVIVDYDRERY